jgi:nucleoside-diphosphate-sugar epimerase
VRPEAQQTDQPGGKEAGEAAAAKGTAGVERVPWLELTALVLGGTGMIGRHVISSLLRRGARVRVLVRPASRTVNLKDLPVERFMGDLDDPSSIGPALRGADLLFHCAAPYPRSHFQSEHQVERAVSSLIGLLDLVRRYVPDEILRLPAGHARQREIEQAQGAASALRYQPERGAEIRNRLRAPGLLDEAVSGRLDAALQPTLVETTGLPGIKRIVYVSSSTTIGRPRGDEASNAAGSRRPANEGDRHDLIRASSPYFAMKKGMEAAATRAAVEGLPLVIGNPTFCVDAFDAAPTSGVLLLTVARGKMPFYFRGTMNVVATRDVGEALVNAASHGRTGQRYILGGENLPVRRFIDMVAEAAQVRAPRFPMPLNLAAAIATLTEVANLLLHRPWPLLPISGVQMLQTSQPFDCSLARSELAMPETPVAVALADALLWFRQNGYLQRGPGLRPRR